MPPFANSDAIVICSPASSERSSGCGWSGSSPRCIRTCRAWLWIACTAPSKSMPSSASWNTQRFAFASFSSRVRLPLMPPSTPAAAPSVWCTTSMILPKLACVGPSPTERTRCESLLNCGWRSRRRTMRSAKVALPCRRQVLPIKCAVWLTMISIFSRWSMRVRTLLSRALSFALCRRIDSSVPLTITSLMCLTFASPFLMCGTSRAAKWLSCHGWTSFSAAKLLLTLTSPRRTTSSAMRSGELAGASLKMLPTMSTKSSTVLMRSFTTFLMALKAVISPFTITRSVLYTKSTTKRIRSISSSR